MTHCVKIANKNTTIAQVRLVKGLPPFLHRLSTDWTATDLNRSSLGGNPRPSSGFYHFNGAPSIPGVSI